MIQLPRLLDKQFHEVARLHPTRLSATDKIDPVSTATMGLPYGEPAVGLRDYVEIFDEDGSKGIYRVESVNASNGERQTLNLSHGIVALEDVLMPADAKLEGNIRTMLETALAQQITPLWVLGDVEAPDNESYTVNAGNAIVLQALIDIAELVPECAFSYNQSVTPWVLHFRKREQSPSCECRLARNMSNISVSFSTQEMCTRVYSKLLPNGYIDADTVSVWGVMSKHLQTKKDTTAHGAMRMAVKYLEQHKHPTTSIEIEAIDLAQKTGESLDSLALGRLCRVALPDWGVTYDHQIVSVYWADLIGKPQQKKLSLATRKIRAETAIAQAKRQSSRNYQHIVETENSVRIQAEKINLMATKAEVEGATTRISNVEIDLDAAKAAIALKADQTVYDDLAKRVSSAEINIDGANAAIALKASQTVVDDLGTRVSAAEIAIDGVNSAIALKADKIDLQGYVTATQLETNYAKITDLDSVSAQVTNLTGGLVTASVLRSTLFTGNQANFTFLTADAFNLGNELVTKRSITMGNVTSAGKALATGELDLNHSHEVTVDANGNLKLGGVAADGGNFNIAETQFYKDGVSASYADGYDVGFDRAQNAYTPTSVTKSGHDTTTKTVYVDVGNAYQPLLTRKPIDATEIYNAGWNECRAAAGSWACLINYYAAGENLYDRDGNLAPGPWYKGTQATRYTLPSPRE